MKTLKFVKLGLAILFILASCYYLLNPTPSTLIDGVNLFIHEAGHLITSPFGEMISVMGGTVMQILIPISFFIYFVKQKSYYSAAIILFWVGQNLCNVSIYAGDALDLKLHLFGGDGVIHDWNYFLENTNQLQNTYNISRFIYILSIIIIGIASFWSIKESLTDQDNSAI